MIEIVTQIRGFPHFFFFNIHKRKKRHFIHNKLISSFESGFVRFFPRFLFS